MHLDSRVRVLLVDDHPVLRAGLANLLKLELRICVVGEAGSGEEAIEVWQKCRPDVCLLDLSMPGLSGLEAMRAILRIAPQTAVVVLTSSESPEHAQRAFEEGAAAYVTKNVAYREIVATILDAHDGRRGIRKGLARSASARHEGILSSRELEVLMKVRAGLSNSEIGKALGIAERTVKFHMTGILEKLGVSDRTGAVVKGFDLGLLHADPPT